MECSRILVIENSRILMIEYSRVFIIEYSGIFLKFSPETRTREKNLENFLHI